MERRVRDVRTPLKSSEDTLCRSTMYARLAREILATRLEGRSQGRGCMLADYTVKPPPHTELAASRTGFVFDAAAVTDVPLSL